MQIPIDEVDAEARLMVVGAEVQPFFQQAMSVSDLVGQLASNPGGSAGIAPGGYGAAENGDVQMGGGNVAMSDVSSAFGVSGGFDFSKLDPNVLSSLAASLGLPGFNLSAGAGAEAASDGSNNNYTLQNGSTVWGGYLQQQQQQQQQPIAPQQQQTSASQKQQYMYSDYDEREREERSVRGGYRGRGRGGPRGARAAMFSSEHKSRRRCNFYAQGRRASNLIFVSSVLSPRPFRVKNSMCCLDE